MDYKTFAVNSLEKACQIAREYFGEVAVTTKPGDNNQVLTEADLEIGKFLVKEIEKIFPEFNIIDEELGVINNGSDFSWVIDPIDGTSNFAAGLPFYGIMLGLINKDKPIAGGVALPYFSEIYYAEKDKGVFCNDRKIYVSKEENLLQTLVCYQIDSHRENPDLTKKEAAILADVLLNSRNIRTSNSVFDIMMVAQGKYGGCLNRTSKIWDNVAQQIIIEESGGIYTDFYGKPIDYSNHLNRTHENYTFCAASPVLHQKLQKILNSI